VFFDVYICFFRSLVGEKYISDLPLSPLKPIHCILLSLVSIGWILKLFEWCFEFENCLHSSVFREKRTLLDHGQDQRYRKKLPAAAANQIAGNQKILLDMYC
jgi:hypothetical protein